MTRDELIALAKNAALDAGLDRALVCAVVEQESGWEPWSIRYEPAFYERYISPLAIGATEGHARAFSWGLLQLMGQVSRELGYTGLLAQLCEPAVGLVWGCKKLKLCLVQSSGNVTEALQRYNGGGNIQYAPQVIARMENYKPDTA